MSDDDIQFGDVEHAEREQVLRPDRNKHYAVVEVESMREGELPVFVDLDAMRDMEVHAQSDTSVELGGVLLGGQYEDEDGNPFVLIVDSLRAKHYENSKGSFKFTHDTWSEITRQRDEFPDDLQMVGWYHTHPDWGVFLSGMDMFICDNFFNKELDVALVIDPCRGDRGWFQWTGDPRQRVRRIGGFHLIASRHRRAELEFYAVQLEGKLTMAHDPRYGGAGGGYPAPIIQVGDSKQSWQGMAVLGILSMQFLFLALLAWKLLFPAVGGEVAEAGKPPEEVQAVLDEFQSFAEAEQRSRRVEAQLDVLNEVMAALDSEGGRGVVAKLEQEKLLNQQLQDDARVYRGLEARVRSENADLLNQLNNAEEDKKYLGEQIQALKDKIRDAETDAKDKKQEIADLKSELKKYTGEDSDEDGEETARSRIWLWAALGGVAVALAVMAFLMSFQAREEELREDEYDEPPVEDESPRRED